MTPIVIVPPAGPLFTIEECRSQCQIVAIDIDSDGIPTHPDDDLVLAFLDAAVEAAEDFTGLSIAERTYEMALDSFHHRHGELLERWSMGYGWPFYARGERRHDYIEIACTPLIEVESFVVGEGSDAVVMEPDVDYKLDVYQLYARLYPVTTWPQMSHAVNLIKIRFRAGYALTTEGTSGVPTAIRQAIMLMVGDWYKNREDSNDKQTFSIPNGVQALLRPKRVRLGAA